MIIDLKDKLTKPLYQKSFDGDSHHTYILFENMDVILEEQTKIAKEYAKEKCKELLEIAAEKAKVYNSKNGADLKYLSIEGDWITIDKESIMNAVDLDSFII